MRSVAIICFFFSGASGLIFEVIWTRMFSLVFGATTLAISTVLTAFMGGLALGSYISGRFADRIRDPLRAYALAEAGVGVTALLLPLVVDTFGGLNQFLYAELHGSYALLAGARFFASAMVMLVPTTLMGATLPLLSRLFIQSRAEQSRIGLRVGTLYAINTAGAMIGTFLGGFVLLPQLGLSATNTLAASANLCLAMIVALAYLIRRRLPAPPPVDPSVAALLNEVGNIPTVEAVIPRAARTASLIGFAMSGAVAMIFQIIWSRALSMNIGSSVYSFTIVLMAFLIGLASGSAVMSRLAARTPNPVGWLGVNHLVVVSMAAISYLLMDKLPFVFLFLIRGEELGATTVLWSQFFLTLLVMLPTTFAMGGIFPLTIRIYSSGLERVGREVGSAYSINTVGAIIGSFFAGFVVIPVLQLEPGQYVAACVSLLLAALLCWLAPWGRRARIAGITAALLLATALPLLPRWNRHHISAGLFRLAIARDVLRSGTWKDPQILFYRDGISTTVSVERWPNGLISLKNNGKVDASTGEDMPTQITVGLLPLLIHPRAPEVRAKVALIGYASGVTAGSILQYPVSRLDVVELEPAILEASRFFDHENNKPMSNPRLRLITDDGRNFLQAGTEKYDVIINEPSNPWITGVSNLFTREYFEIGKRRLKPDGIFCTWAQMYEISPRHIKAIYKTFAGVFPYVYAFSAEALSSDTFLIGSRRPLTMDLPRMGRAFDIPSIKKELRRANISRPEDLAALTLLGPGEVDAFAMGAELNTDDNALIEFGAPRDMYNHNRYDYYTSRVYSQSWIYGRLDGFISGLSSSEDYARLVKSLLTTGKFREAHYLFERVRRDEGAVSARVSQLMDLLASRGVKEDEIPLDIEGPPLIPPKIPPKIAGKQISAETLNRMAQEYFIIEQRIKEKMYRSALDLIESWPEEVCEQAGTDFNLLWGFVVYKCGDFHTAVNILEPLLEDKAFVARRPALLYYLGRTFYGNADFQKSIQTFEKWISRMTAAHRPIAPQTAPITPGEGQLRVLP